MGTWRSFESSIYCLHDRRSSLVSKVDVHSVFKHTLTGSPCWSSSGGNVPRLLSGGNVWSPKFDHIDTIIQILFFYFQCFVVGWATGKAFRLQVSAFIWTSGILRQLQKTRQSVVLQCECCASSFSSQIVGKVQHGRLSKYFFEDLEAVYPAGKVVTAKILRSVSHRTSCLIFLHCLFHLLPTALAREVMQSPLYVYLSICFHSVFGTDWLMTLNFCR